VLRSVLVLLLLLMGRASPLYGHPPAHLNAANEIAVAEEVRDFRTRLAQAIKAKDAAALRDMYADSFQHTHTTAKRDGRSERIASALAGEALIETADVEDFSVRAHAGGWVAIASGRSPIASAADGRTYAVVWTAVYVRTPTGWALAASQATRSHEIKTQ
jgi:ketosteroid isomerase-like protein